MKSVCLATVIAIAVLAPSAAFGQLSIINFQYAGEQPQPITLAAATYSTDVVNTNNSLASVLATIRSWDISSVQVLVPVNTFQVNTFQSFQLPPVVNAGHNESVIAGSTLDASKLVNQSGIGPLTYSWAFTSRPAVRHGHDEKSNGNLEFGFRQSTESICLERHTRDLAQNPIAQTS